MHRAQLQTCDALALADLNEAVKVDSENMDALILRSSLFDIAGDKERSFLDLRRVTIIAPQVRPQNKERCILVSV